MEKINIKDLDESYVGRQVLDVGTITKITRQGAWVDLEIVPPTSGRKTFFSVREDFHVLLEDA